MLWKGKIKSYGYSWHPSTLGIPWTCGWKCPFCLQTKPLRCCRTSAVSPAIAEHHSTAESWHRSPSLSLPAMCSLESWADTPQQCTASWSDVTVTVICHIKCDPMNFVMEPQQKWTQMVPPASTYSYCYKGFLSLGSFSHSWPKET